MHLYQASPAHAALVPLLIFEVLKDDGHPPPLSPTSVTHHGIIHVDRIPFIHKVYVVEPAVKQVVLTNNLHAVSLVFLLLLVVPPFLCAGPVLLEVIWLLCCVWSVGVSKGS